MVFANKPAKNKQAGTESFKHFKDGFFKVVVKEPGRSYFYNDDGNTKFPFSWTDNPWRYKDMKREKLSRADREVVETLIKFNDKMSTKGLVRVYNSIHPIVDIKGIFLCFKWYVVFELTNRCCCYYCRSYGTGWQEKFEFVSNFLQGEGDRRQKILGILKFPTCKILW